MTAEEIRGEILEDEYHRALVELILQSWTCRSNEIHKNCNLVGHSGTR